MPKLTGGAPAAPAQSPGADTPAPTPKPSPAKEEPKKAAPTRSAATKIEGFASLDESSELIKWLAYGPEGSGKTSAALSAANHGRVLVINQEGGLKKTALRRLGIETTNVSVWPDPAKGGEVTARSLEKLHETLLGQLQDDPTAWFAVVMDSISEIHHVLREQATEGRVDKAAKKGLEIDSDFVDRDDYGVMTNQLRKVLRRFRDLPCHVIITALEKVDDDTKQNRPHITPALAIDLMGYMDIVSAHKAEGDGLPFRALTSASARTRAKDRFGILPKVLAEPSFSRIASYVGGDFTEAGGDDPIQLELDAALAAKAAAKEAAEAERAAAKKTPAKKAPAKKAALAPAAPAAEATPEEGEK